MSRAYYVLWGLLCLFFANPVQAQTSFYTKTPTRFTQPLKEGSYEKGKLLVKFKAIYKDQLNQPTTVAARFQEAVRQIGGKTWGNLYHEKEIEKAGRTENFFRPTIDLALYYEARYDANKVSIEEAMQKLYATGLLDYVEPSFIRKSFYTPNDTEMNNQYYLNRIKAMEAWDISKGDSNVVIAIVDSGVQLSHPDLANKIKYNPNDPINGIDDDRDGFVDNNRGWDFLGADVDNFKADNNPSCFAENTSHGSYVAGCAAADTDNKAGIAGVGFNCKILPIKQAADNDTKGEGGVASLYGTFLGIIYAANHGATIINCSYGSSDYSQTEQDAVTYATEKGCLVVAAAGNSGTREASYPASYDYVLSVGSTTQSDAKSSFSTFHYTVDIAAPGSGIYSTTCDRGYNFTQGTSFSSPITAGAAGLLKAAFPQFSGLQIGELLRATADNSGVATNMENPEELGKGRLNVQRALTEKPFAVKLLNYKILNKANNNAQAGDTATVTGEFINYLYPTTPNCKVKLTTTSPFVQIQQGELTLGTLATLQRRTNTNSPFSIIIKKDVPKDTEIILRLSYEDAGRTDFQYIAVVINPSFYIINKNAMTTSIGSIGRIGYEDTEKQSGGVGFTYNGTPMLYELGLIIGNSASKVPNSVRATGRAYHNDFKPLDYIKENTTSLVSDYDLSGSFNDDNAGSRKIGVLVTYRSYVWKSKPNDKYFIVDYLVKNTTTSNLSNLYVGLFADWDIAEAQRNRAKWDEANRLGYIYDIVPSGLYGGIQLLTRNVGVNHYPIDNDDTKDINVYDGFTEEEKYKTLSNGTKKAQAGFEKPEGNDVSHVVSAGAFTLKPNEFVQVAFAFHAGDNLADLQQSAQAAQAMYDRISTRIMSTQDEIFAQNITVYPNPNNGQFEIALQNEYKGDLQISVQNLAGQVLYQQQVSKDVENFVTTVRTPQLPAGIYLLQIKDKERVATKKIVVQ